MSDEKEKDYVPTEQERIDRFGGPMTSWSGGDGQERLRLAIALAEQAEAEEELAKAEARLRELRGEDPKA